MRGKIVLEVALRFDFVEMNGINYFRTENDHIQPRYTKKPCEVEVRLTFIIEPSCPPLETLTAHRHTFHGSELWPALKSTACVRKHREDKDRGVNQPPLAICATLTGVCSHRVPSCPLLTDVLRIGFCHLKSQRVHGVRHFTGLARWHLEKQEQGH